MQQINLKDISREEWLKLRMNGLGGSDIATALGMNPYKQPIELWYEKTGKLEPEDLSDKQHIEWGNRLEDVVAEAYTDKTGLKVRRKNFMVFDENDPHLYANIDREVVGQNRVLECKTAGAFARRDEWGPGNTYDEAGGLNEVDTQVPASYLMQVSLYMHVLGKDTADLAVLIGGNDFRMYSFMKDNELTDLMLQGAREFWALVEQGVAPPIDYSHPSTAALLKRNFCDVEGGMIRLPGEIQHWRNVMAESKEKVKQYQSVADVAEMHILETMGNHPVGILPDGSIFERKLQTRKAFEMPSSTFVRLYHKSGKPAEKIIEAFTPQLEAPSDE